MTALYDCRDGFSQTLVELARANDKVVAVCNDSVGSSKLNNFQKEFPQRLVNVGIAEQNMIGVAAGLANGGLLPFVCGASCFMTGRALEQIKADLAYSNANVKLCGISSGVAYGALGPTHHSIEDIAWLRAIAGMTIIVPADPLETIQALNTVAEFEGPVFLRVSRMGTPAVHPEDYQFQIGKAFKLREGKDLTIIANGTMVARAVAAAEKLSVDGIEARVLNMATVSPLDKQAIIDAAVETGRIITVEEATISGGLGSAVAEVVTANHPVPVKILGIPGVFAPTGSAEWILDHFGLNAEGIYDSACEIVGLEAKK
ncbi:MAG TPA: transketolase family protein [Pyrinomonadaceae bacterium]|nr:transketolase family protein [Pyrinomonadaceae bacterium]